LNNRARARDVPADRQRLVTSRRTIPRTVIRIDYRRSRQRSCAMPIANTGKFYSVVSNRRNVFTQPRPEADSASRPWRLGCGRSPELLEVLSACHGSLCDQRSLLNTSPMQQRKRKNVRPGVDQGAGAHDIELQNVIRPLPAGRTQRYSQLSNRGRRYWRPVGRRRDCSWRRRRPNARWRRDAPRRR